MNIEPDPVKSAEDSRVTRSLAKSENYRKKQEQQMQNYMDRHGITDATQLTGDEDLSPEVLEAIEQQVKRQPSKSRKKAR